MGVCCIVFEINGILFEKNGVGGNYFLEKLLSHFISHFMLFPTFKKTIVFWGNIESAPSHTG